MFYMECTVARQPEAATAAETLERLVVGAVAITARALAAAGADLTFLQWRVLYVVGATDGGATVGEIAARLQANSSPASRIVSRMSRRGLVQATRDDPDRRVTRVRLTEAGRELRARVLDHRRRDLDDVLHEASLTSAEVTTVHRLARAFESAS